MLARNLDEKIEKLAVGVEATTGAATETMVQAKETLSTAEWVISEDSTATHELITVLRELSAAAKAIRILAEYFERHPDALIRGKDTTGGE